MLRASTLARVLRDLKVEREEISERKSVYDHDTNRAIVALSRFTKIVQKETAPDTRRTAGPDAGGKKESAPPPPPPPEISEDKPDDDSDPTPVWAKRAYRLIALKTHPDRINSDESLTDSQRDRLVSLYREATEAYHNKNYEALAEVAAELEIEVDMPVADLEKALESKIKSVRSEIANMQKTLSWHWGISFGDMQKRVLVLKGCCKVMKIPTPEDSVLEDIIKELESQPDFDIVDRLGRVRRIKSGADRRKLGTRPVKRIR
jgi:hypothetical protein